MIDPDKLAAFLSDASRYFANRPIHGEDAAHWSNVYNAENCQKASAAILAMAEERAGLERQLRISAWNEARAIGKSQDAALEHVETVVKRALGEEKA